MIAMEIHAPFFISRRARANCYTPPVAPMSESPFLSLVIPAYNEARRLPRTLAELAEFCGGLRFPFEVWIVVERSTDETLELAARFAARQAQSPRLVVGGD